MSKVPLEKSPSEADSTGGKLSFKFPSNLVHKIVDYSLTAMWIIIIRTTSLIRLHFSANQSLAGHATGQSQHGPVGHVSDTLVKLILVLLSGLLLANSVLFYKMWSLESQLGTPLANLEELVLNSVDSTGSGNVDKSTWIKLLQRQEAAHQLELQKWHDLLGAAAGLLHQVTTIKTETADHYPRAAGTILSYDVNNDNNNTVTCRLRRATWLAG